ncbi:MAG: hypothetical protein NZ935_12155, partial [Planctomycetes bacterium]|nr:hypothetical protein [Planctomycetota bacterium]
INFDFALAAYPRKTLIPRGPDGSFDKDCARPPMNIITHQDEHWIYYLATNERWGARKWDARLGLAKLRLDGFFFLEAGARPGSLVTRPFKLKGTAVEVNVDAKKGWVKIELLDKKNNPISGLSSRHDGVDQLRLKPGWKLSGIEGKTVKLKFTLQDAKLYAFGFIDQYPADSAPSPGNSVGLPCPALPLLKKPGPARPPADPAD